MIEKELTIPVINQPFVIIFYTAPEQLAKWFEGFPYVEFSSDPEEFQGGVFEMDGKVYGAFLDDGKLTPGMISHEANHILNRSFKIIHQERSIDNDELDSYFLEWIVDRIHECKDSKE